MKRQIPGWLLALIALSALLLAAGGCHSQKDTADQEQQHAMPDLSPVSLGAGEKLQVVATTSIVADVVQNVGGDRIELNRLLPLGSDPHAFEPTPRDVATVSEAHVVFANGLGLEVFLDPLLESAGATDRVVHVSHDVALVQAEAEHEHEAGHEHHHEGDDPHTWTDPNNVIVWVGDIQHALSALDPANAGVYQANAEAYVAELEALDAWVRAQVAQIPPENRKIVADHQLFAYLAKRYDFVQVGAVVPGYTTAAEPSAKELAELEDAIRDLGVKAVFVGHSVNPSLAQRVAEDTGVQLVFLYTGSLSEADGEAGTYLDYVRYNINAIVGALK